MASTRGVLKAWKKTAHLVGKHQTATIGVMAVIMVGTAIMLVARGADPAKAAPSAHAQAPASSPAELRTASPVAATRTAATSARPAAAEKEKAVKTSGDSTDPVTIVGCLAQSDKTFVLKDTSGEDAPKGRSWKSGFLKKSAKTLEVVDDQRRLNLASHVGEQVSITGLLDDRDFRGTSLRRVAAGCN